MSESTDHSDEPPNDPSLESYSEDDPDDEDTGYSTLAVLISALVGLGVMTGSYLLVQANNAFFESLYRVQPTIEGGGVGSDWVAGNTDPLLELMITIIHIADFVMGLFLIVIVVVHWAAFRRLASRMRSPGDPAPASVDRTSAERESRDDHDRSSATGGGGE